MFIQARTLSGFRDKLPEEAIAKAEMLSKIVTVFESFGFVPIETPHLEHADILVKQGSDEIQKEIYAFRDHGGRDVALRFDLTVPLARFITQHRQELSLPFKRYAIGNVFRGERAQKGRYREFTQCDFDFIGSRSIASDSEIIQIIAEIMQSLEVGRFQISINHRSILNGICEHLGIRGDGAVSHTLRIIDKLQKIGADGVRAELKEALDLGDESITELLRLVGFRQEGSFAEFFTSIEALRSYNATLGEAIGELEALAGILEPLGLPPLSCVFDFSIARGLGYYTGIIYETTLLDLPSLGSVCSGGRYDSLTQTFGKEELSGVGASVGLDRLLAGLIELGKLKLKQTKTELLCVAMDEAQMPFTQTVAQSLRKRGIKVEVYPDYLKMAKIFSYADKKGIGFVAVIGEEEMKGGRVSLKKMKSGEQWKLIEVEEVEKKMKEE